MYLNISVNSTSSSLLPLHLSSSNSSILPAVNSCFRSTVSILVFAAVSVTQLLIFPLFIFAIYLRYLQWKQQRSTSTAAANHSNLFMYHSITMQLLSFLGFIVFFCSNYVFLQELVSVGLCIRSVMSLGQALFHLFTCVEHYLAVVHPFAYLRLRNSGGLRIRNIYAGCVWLLCGGWAALLYLSSPELSSILHYCVISFFLAIVSFCSISVLWVLKRPGPGEVGGNRARVDQSKQRAFYTIMMIMGVLLIRFGGNLISNMMFTSTRMTPREMCVVPLFTFLWDLPSCLVLPLLFLHRAGKLACCKTTTQSG